MFWKRLKKGGSLMLATCMLLGSVQFPTLQVNAAEGQNLALSATATASGVEDNAATLVASKANDGNKATRWASPTGNGQKWLQLAWPQAQTVKSFVIQWERRNATDYNISVSNDGENWKSVWASTEIPSSKKQTVTLNAPEQASYVRLNINTFNSKPADAEDATWNNVSVFEFEAYADEIPDGRTELEKAAAAVTAPQLTDNNHKITMPVLTEGLSAKFCADYEQIIGEDGTVYTPVETKTVTGFYELSDGTNQAKTAEYTIVIPGSYTDGEGANARPEVIPALQEWHGETGDFVTSASSRIVAAPELSVAAAEFAADYKDITGKEIPVVTGTKADVQMGDFCLTLDTADGGLGKEGYILTVGDTVLAEASDATGAYWATRSILQILKQTGDKIPRGIARDYPKYEVRGFMLDVGRKTFELDTLKELAENMAWYKMNDFHVHLSDNLIFLEDYDSWEDAMANAYAGFRLESGVPNDKGETVTAKDLYYTKDEFRSFIQESRNMGVNIVPELDMPAHSLALTRTFPQYALKNNNNKSADHLDIKQQGARDLAKNIFGDYMTDTNPVFDESTTVHIGTDEFSDSAQAFREFSDEMIAFVQDKNRQVRLWGSLTTMAADVDVRSENVQMNIWNTGWANPQAMYDQGFDLINTVDGALYMVPAAGYYGDYLNAQSIYSSWMPNRMGGTTISAADDQMLGATYAIWHDMIDTRQNGISEYDSLDRFFQPLPAFSQKLWGENEDRTWQEFTEISEKTSTAPNTNIYSEAESKTDTILNYTFNDEAMSDSSGNNYGILEQKNISQEAGKSKKALRLNGGESYVKTPVEQVGPVNSISMWVKKDAGSTQDEQILSEYSTKFGTYALKAVQKGTGKVGFSREGCDYSFDYTLPDAAWVYLTINGYREKAELYVNGEFVSNASLDNVGSHLPDGARMTATLVLPTERFGSTTNSFKGLIDEVTVKNTAQVKEDFSKVSQSLMTPSACSWHAEGPVGNAVDGDASTYWHTDWGSKDVITASHSHWYQVDLKTPMMINKLTYLPRQDNVNGRIYKYNIIVTKTDGTEVTVVENGVWDNNANEKTATFEPVEAQKVKMVILDAAGDSSGKHGTMAELNLYRVFSKADAQELFEKYTGLDSLQYTEASWVLFEQAYAQMKEALEKADESVVDFSAVYTSLRNAAEALVEVETPAPDFTELENAVKEAEKMDLNGYTAESAAVFKNALEDAKAVLGQGDVTQEQIDAALKALETAKAALKVKPDFSKLKNAAAEAEKIDLSKYTTDSVNAFKNALTGARTVLGQSGATQAQIDAALKALEAAKAALKVKPPVVKPDLSKLSKAVAEAGKLDLNKYTTESVSTFKKALAGAKAVLGRSDATQGQIDMALKTLEAAKAALKAAKQVPAAGSYYTSGALRYKVTKTSAKYSSKRTVSVTKVTSKNKTKIVIPATVKIKGYTFKVTAISSKVFQSSKKLTTLVIGSNVKSIGTSCFYKCSKLGNITFMNGTAATIGKSAFKSIKSNCKITVPKKMNSKQYKSLKKKMTAAGISKKAIYKKK